MPTASASSSSSPPAGEVAPEGIEAAPRGGRPSLRRRASRNVSNSSLRSLDGCAGAVTLICPSEPCTTLTATRRKSLRTKAAYSWPSMALHQRSAISKR